MRDMIAGAGHPAAVPVCAPIHYPSSGAKSLEVSTEKIGSTTRLSLRGRLDRVSAAAVYDLIVASAAPPTSELHLDLNGLDGATRVACRAIHVAAKLLHSRGGHMTIFGVRPNVEMVLKDTGFDALIDFRYGEAPSVVATSTVQGSTSRQLRDVA